MWLVPWKQRSPTVHLEQPKDKQSKYNHPFSLNPQLTCGRAALITAQVESSSVLVWSCHSPSAQRPTQWSRLLFILRATCHLNKMAMTAYSQTASWLGLLRMDMDGNLLSRATELSLVTSGVPVTSKKTPSISTAGPGWSAGTGSPLQYGAELYQPVSSCADSPAL